MATAFAVLFGKGMPFLTGSRSLSPTAFATA